ncbi:hypothetical protein [Echinimonas agarilytica]|uniref:PEP-CTERM protein-sorting domain-containing protein n=1 Tax=Echinimonas agarilytica TaxID=1215918 RepID=A0AA41W8D5_9GAMM|nr:hypothetical protein [Echinimonas agarilytica]MCM2680298.1 hypothetical protein [Echinimonas agarilytica]
MSHHINTWAPLALILCSSFSATASVISTEFDQTDYAAGDNVAMDVFVNAANPDIMWLDFDLEFNDTELLFEQFDFTSEVINSSFYADAYDFFGAAPLTISVEFADSWDNALSRSFKLGTASFSALANTIPSASLGYFSAEDANGNTIEQTQIPEPPAWALVGLSLMMLGAARKKHPLK